MLSDAAQICNAIAKSAFEPDPLLTVSEWADRFRKLSQSASAEAGQWRTSRTPYIKEIMDALSPSSSYQEIIFMKASQLGGTECGNNWMGYVIDYAPGPMLCVQPTVELAKRNSKQRIDPLIQECERLREKVRDPRSRDSGNTILSKEYPGGLLVMTGANSAVGLRSLPARYLFLDEVDAYPGDVDNEGDPVALARARTRTFARKKIFIVSTPTVAGRSRIESLFQQTDQRRYHVPCPHCRKYQVLQWSNLKWPQSKPEEAVYNCDVCGEKIEEHHKTWMLEKGKWIAENPELSNNKKVGFHLNSLYSPMGWFSWANAAELWEESHKDPPKLKGFINTVLGETWKDKGEAPDWQRLYERRELYAFNSVPQKGIFLTCGVDVQKDRLECEVVAWGRQKISWSIDYRVLPGDTSAPEVWKQLEEILTETWVHPSGLRLSIKLMAVDSGFNTQQVYSWCRKFPMNRVIALKGMANANLMIGHPKAVDVTAKGKRHRHGLKIWPAGVNLIKSELYGFLRQPKAIDGEEDSPGYCHFPQYDEEYFKQLTAEELVVKIIKGYRHYEWQKIRDRNEALDCRIYARAAAAACGIDRFTEEHWKKMEGEMGVTRSSKEAKTPVKTIQRRKSDYWS